MIFLVFLCQINNEKTVVTIYLPIFFVLFLPKKGFQFESGVNKISIPFKLINNLVFIPIKVNGVELNFLLDTETILFI
jgi:hypothetical protein